MQIVRFKQKTSKTIEQWFAQVVKQSEIQSRKSNKNNSTKKDDIGSRG